MQSPSEEILLVYDKECPVCHAYCQNVQVRDDVGPYTIVDARAASEIRDEITARGLDIDQGMVLKKNGELYYGAEAIHQLSLLTRRSNWFNRVNYWTFRSPALSSLLYPVLRSLRNLLLKLLRKTKINNLGRANNDFF